MFNFQFGNWSLSGFEPENSRMVSELANHLTTNWCLNLILMTSYFKHFCVSRHVAHDEQVIATRCTVSLRHIYRSNSLYGLNLSNGISDSIPGYEAIGPRFDPESRRCYLLLIYNVQFFQFINGCLSGFEPENSRKVSELANHLTTKWCFSFDLIDKLFQTYLRLASSRWWRTGERDATHRVSTTYFYITFPLFTSSPNSVLISVIG